MSRVLLSPFRFVGLIMVAAVALCSCKNDNPVSVNRSIDVRKMPTMTTRNVATFISDSGIVQYKIVAPIWYVYDETDTPYWSFPKGLYLEKYDRKFKVTASVACDSAIYLKRQQIWRLDGHVEMRNAPSDIFLTPQLFWNQRDHTLYSDSFIHVENKSRVIEGYGFNSNERLTTYRVLRPSGIFPVNPENMQTAGVAEMPSPAGRMSSAAAASPVSPVAPGNH